MSPLARCEVALGAIIPAPEVTRAERGNMNAYEESAYYSCGCDCNLCDGYGWLEKNPPVGCIVAKEAISSGRYCCYDGGRVVTYIKHAENPEDALAQAQEWVNNHNYCVKDSLRVGKII